MANKVSCFVAYPSNPLSLAETIKESISNIAKGQTVDICGWESTNIGGKFIITAICKAIDEKDIFICDLTTLNHNVLFELGYAIAKNKRIWVLLNPSIEKSESDYLKFQMLTTIGYVRYYNSHDIVNAFYKEKPFDDLDKTIYKDAIESVIEIQEGSKLLYLKSLINSDSSIKLSVRVASSIIPSIVDDPKEVPIQTLSWYAQEVNRAYAVVVHFLSSEHTGRNLHNAKNSFVAGLAYGFDRHILMLAHSPYTSPLDYRDLLKVHDTSAECDRFVFDWLREVESDFNKKVQVSRAYQRTVLAHAELQNLNIGDPIAEHESNALLDYFIQTASYIEALRSDHSIFIGRKGSGKTAILFKLANEIREDKRNHVCILKPVAYELHGILRMLKQTLHTSESGYLVESFWRFLIYTELAKSVYESLKSNPTYYSFSEAEKSLINFVEKNISIVLPDFSIRLENIVGGLQHIEDFKAGEQQRSKISELLHSTIIVALRSVLGEVLQHKNKVAFIFDNLDKAWDSKSDTPLLSDLLLSLLDVSRRISQDFHRSGTWRKPINLSLIIFLRSDIFSQILKNAPERDKIPYSRISWNDSELLLRVLEERFMVASSIKMPSEIWNKYFCNLVDGILIKEFIIHSTLPRPRDIIYLVKTAMDKAINRRHMRIEASDMKDARMTYSQYVLESLIAESYPEIEMLLYEFVGKHEIININDVCEVYKTCSPKVEFSNEIVDLLCDLTFLGREVENSRFEYQYDDDQKIKLTVMARKTALLRDDKLARFRINCNN